MNSHIYFGNSGDSGNFRFVAGNARTAHPFAFVMRGIFIGALLAVLALSVFAQSAFAQQMYEPPVADAGEDRNAMGGDTVILDPSGSTGDISGQDWDRLNADGTDYVSSDDDNCAGRLFSNPGDATGIRRFLIPLACEGELIFRLTSFPPNDAPADIPFGEDTVTITVLASPIPPVCDRSIAVQNAIVAADLSTNQCNEVTSVVLAGITTLDLSNQNIGGLQAGDFNGMTGLVNLDLSNNPMTQLPANALDPLTALVNLSVDRLAPILSVTPNLIGQLELSWIPPVVGRGNGVSTIRGYRIEVSADGGDTFADLIGDTGDTDTTYPHTITGQRHYRISAHIAVGGGNPAVGPVSTTVSGLSRVAPTTIEPALCERTQAVRDEIVSSIAAASACGDVTPAQLAELTSLDLSGDSIAMLAATDFNGMVLLETLNLSGNMLTTLPNNIFMQNDLLTEIDLSGNMLDHDTDTDGAAFGAMAFAGLENLRILDLSNNQFRDLPDGLFDDLDNLVELDLSDITELASVPVGIFDGLNNLQDLRVQPLAPREVTATVTRRGRVTVTWTASPVAITAGLAATISGYSLSLFDHVSGQNLQALIADSASYTSTSYIHRVTADGNFRYRVQAHIGTERSATTDSAPIIAAAPRSIDDAVLNQLLLPEVARAIAGNSNVIGGRIRQAGLSTGRVAHANVGGRNVGSGDALSAALLDAAANERDVKNVLANSNFAMPIFHGGWRNTFSGFGGDGSIGPNTVFWGGGEQRSIGGKSLLDTSTFEWDGSMTAIHLGVDGRVGGKWLGGAALSSFATDLEYEAGTEGNYEVSLMSLTPYFGWASEGGNFWVSGGYGSGEVEIMREGVDKSTNDLTMTSFAIGGETEISTTGSLITTVKGEVAQTNLEADKTTADPNPMDVEVMRSRLALELADTYILAGGSLLKPTVEVAARYDGGDGENGHAAEIGAGIKYQTPGHRFAAELNTRNLVFHEGNFEESGIQGTIRLRPGLDGQGLSFHLSPTYGDMQSRVNQVWDDGFAALDTAADANADANADEYAMRVDARLGYGLSLRDGGFGGLITPYSEMTVGSVDSYRAGLQWDSKFGIDVDLVGERREAIEAENSVLLKGSLSF